MKLGNLKKYKNFDKWTLLDNNNGELGSLSVIDKTLRELLRNEKIEKKHIRLKFL